MGSRILVVEDETDLAELVAINLRGAGHDVAVAHDGKTALAEIQRSQPDLLVLDVMLPDISGIEVCRRLRRSAQTVRLPVIMLTARTDEVDRVVGFEVGPAVGLAVAAVGIAAASTTEHRVLAQTSRGLRLLRGSRIRQVAVELIGPLPDDTPIEMTGHRFVLSEWRVGDHDYTVPKSSEGAMTRIATSR